MSEQLDRLERSVLWMLLAGDDPVLEVMARQLECASIKSRTLTGAGFYVDFDVPPEAARIAGEPSFHFGDLGAVIDGLLYGAGFVLHVENGVLSSLEGYSYQEDWPKSIGVFTLSYNAVPRAHIRV